MDPTKNNDYTNDNDTSDNDMSDDSSDDNGDGVSYKYIWYSRYINNIADFNCIPQKYISKQLATKAVKKFWGNLKYVPYDLLSKKLCENAFNANFQAIKDIPKKYITPTMCDIVLNRGVRYELLKCLPEKYLTKENIIKCIKNSPYDVCEIPFEHLTIEMFDDAFKRTNSYVYKYLPQKYKTREVRECARKYTDAFCFLDN